MAVDGPCAIVGMPNDVYHAHEGSVSNSGLVLVDRSPAHYQSRDKWESTRAKEIGSAIHAALLEPDVFARDFFIVHGTHSRTDKAYRKAKEDFGAEFTFTEDEGKKIIGTQQSILANKNARSLLDEPHYTEISIFANDPETGVLVRVRFDLLTESGRCVDLKKTRDARSEEFQKAIWNYKYHRQAAFYCDVFHWFTGTKLLSYEWWAIEEEAPHALKIYEPDDFCLDAGRFEYRRALDVYAECAESGIWPPYPSEKELIGLPPYAAYRLEDEMDKLPIKFPGDKL